MKRINTSADTSVIAFTREKEGDRVFVIANLTGDVKDCQLKGEAFKGKYKEWFTGEEISLKKGDAVRMKPWEYKVYIKK